MKFLNIYAMIFFILILTPSVMAQTGHIKLVTAIDGGTTTKVGGTPDLYLEIRPGEGNIYLDSIPLTKVDTQISARFAKSVACSFLEKDCSNKDFFYKIRAGSNIVGGPSAGASITVLTIAMLDNQPLDESVVMTGTINPGGIIGPVGGIREKAIAAEQAGLKKFLIPSLSLTDKTSLKNISENLSIEIVPVTNIEEALLIFTGKNYSKELPELRVPDEYTMTMREVSEKLCSRFSELQAKQDVLEMKKTNNSLYNSAMEFYNKSVDAGQKYDYYSKASFCFTGNLRLRDLELQKYSQEKLLEGYAGVKNQIAKFEAKIDAVPLRTLSDLETYMIVKERIIESKAVLNEINTSNISSSSLAYAYERLYSGVYWSDFFNLDGEEFVLENEQLRDSCFEKLSEAKERIDYVSLYFPLSASIDRFTEDLSYAYQYFESEDYELCIFKASKVKADADSIFELLFIEEDQVNTLLEQKLSYAKKNLEKQQSKGMFPILGYSYYEYAQSLKDEDPYSSLLYLEYSMELSNLDMYFPPKKSSYLEQIDFSQLWVFVMGVVFGALVVLLIIGIKKDLKKWKNQPSKNPKKNMKKTQKDSKKGRNLPGKKR